ncbi:HEAT repeat domain-containing protein [Paenibacillus sp. strain BS8-2]
MDNSESKYELPPNYDELRTAANRTSNWRERLDAVEELGQWNTQKTIDVLTHRLNNDTVYQVREAAYRKLKQFGEDVQLPPRKTVELNREVSKVLVRIKKSLPNGHTYEEFKEKFKKMRLDIYDTYEGDKGADFDKWLEGTWASLLLR